MKKIRMESAAPNAAASRNGERLLVLIGLATIYALLLSRFNLRLLFTDTILTGGDSASWLQPLKNLKNEYLPRLRLFGYSQSNFFGYLEGQHYFVLPFLSAALLGYLMPLTVALKIVTFAGCAALPLTMYSGLSSISGSRKAGLAGAALSLLFLFNESYSMFGGNFLSTFAGEFCYSWAIALLPLYIAAVWKDHTRKRFSPFSGILLGLIGLCHLFVFMPAFFLPFFFAFRGRNFRRGAAKKSTEKDDADEVPPSELALRIPFTCLMALLVMAFWFLPMATTRVWAQSISMVWHFSSIIDFSTQTLMPVWMAAAIALTVVAIRTKGESRRKALFIIYGLWACAVMFVVSKFLETPDIRFIPSALIFSIFAAGIAFPTIKLKLPGPVWLGRIGTAATIAVLVATVPAVLVMSRNSPSWFAWNYSGYEAKQGWPDLKAIAAKYSGTAVTGRFLWEKQNQRDNADFGSERGFENIYMFTGFPSAEGIHYGSSFMARATTYLQSAYSPEPVDPEAWRLYSRVDPESWPLRFTQANARYIVTHTQEITSLFAGRPEFALDFRSGKYSVFEYLDYPASWVEAIDPGALSIVGDSPGGFKTDFYRFFRDYELIRRPFVPASFADRNLRSRVTASYRSYDDLRSTPPFGEWKSYATSSAAAARAASGKGIGGKFGDFSISFDVEKPGTPHIIKVSYAPGWRSKSGEKIYPVSPGFMLVYPRGSHIELVYGRTATEIAGIVLTVLAIPFGFACARLARRGLKRYRAFFIFMTAAYIVVIGTLLGLSVFGSAQITPDIERARSLDLTRPGPKAVALRLVEPYTRMRELERHDDLRGFEAFRIKAAILASEGKNAEAGEIIAMLRNRYPHCRALDTLPAQ